MLEIRVFFLLVVHNEICYATWYNEMMYADHPAAAFSSLYSFIRTIFITTFFLLRFIQAHAPKTEILPKLYSK